MTPELKAYVEHVGGTPMTPELERVLSALLPAYGQAIADRTVEALVKAGYLGPPNQDEHAG